MMTTSVDSEVATALASMRLARLTHFTPAMNLPNIFSDGELRSVKALSEDLRACYRATDLRRLDGHPDKICCSLQYPNGFYFDIAQKKPDVINYPDWVCLLLDKYVAATHGTVFCSRNAAAAAGQAVPGVAGLAACYAPRVIGQGGREYTRGAQHDAGSPTDVQAEVLVPGPIPQSSIRGIVFATEGKAKQEYGRLDRFGLLPPTGVQWVVSPGMFEKWTIANAVKWSHYFPEHPWSPEAAS